MREFLERFPTGGIAPRNIRNTNQRRRLEVQDCINEGMKTGEIADALGLSRSWVNDIIKIYGLRRRV